MSSYDQTESIITDASFLCEKHVPREIWYRSDQFGKVMTCISPAFSGLKPMNVWLHGKPGTGKTTVAQHALSEFRKRTGCPGIYVNCWKYNTFYSVLEYIIDDLKRGFCDARDTTVKIKQIERLIKDRPFLVVLDEIDLMSLSERNDMIYNLHSLGKAGLVCISESRSPILTLEKRIMSRLTPQIISFGVYSDQALIDILNDRALSALASECWNDEALRFIAEKANGDSRLAIKTLKNAATYAIADKSKKINRDHISKGFSDTGSLNRTYELKCLTDHHKLIYSIIKDRPGIDSSKLFSSYIEGCAERDWKPVASRTFSFYLKKMTELRLISSERARARGRINAFRVIHTGCSS